MAKTLWQVLEHLRECSRDYKTQASLPPELETQYEVAAYMVERWARNWAAFGDTLKDFPIQGGRRGTAQFRRDILGLPAEREEK